MNFGEITSRIRNLFQPAQLVKRNDDGTVQVRTSYNRTIDNLSESFPYGFTAKAKKGDITLLCAGGNLDAVRILPAESVEGAPALNDGDVAVYSSGGSFIVCRDDGTVEANGTENGGVIVAPELKKQLAVMTARIDAVYMALKASPTAKMDGGETYKAGIAAALSGVIQKEDFSNIESDKVLHGKGDETENDFRKN